jgi:hypothetical protein
MQAQTTIRPIEQSTPPATGELAAALGRANLTFERRDGGLCLLRAPCGRRVYVEERAHGLSGRASWLVHVDGFGAEAPRQLPCATIGQALIAVRMALSGLAAGSGREPRRPSPPSPPKRVD